MNALTIVRQGSSPITTRLDSMWCAPSVGKLDCVPCVPYSLFFVVFEHFRFFISFVILWRCRLFLKHAYFLFLGQGLLHLYCRLCREGSRILDNYFFGFCHLRDRGTCPSDMCDNNFMCLHRSVGLDFGSHQNRYERYHRSLSRAVIILRSLGASSDPSQSRLLVFQGGPSST